MKPKELKLSAAARIVEKIKSNGHRCALSGWSISASCFELDHIVSMNDGGTDEVDNLQAVHPLVNRAKGTMGNQQFIDMCMAVADFTRGDRTQAASWSEVEDVAQKVRTMLAGPPAEVGSSGSNRT